MGLTHAHSTKECTSLVPTTCNDVNVPLLNLKALAGRRVGEGHEEGVLTLSAKSTPMVAL